MCGATENGSSNAQGDPVEQAEGLPLFVGIQRPAAGMILKARLATRADGTNAIVEKTPCLWCPGGFVFGP